jgi:alpha-tubulin suppressor-like RCC1 family protein
VDAGSNYTCGITTTSVLYCWGSFGSGQLGIGPGGGDRREPVAVGGALRFSSVSAGITSTCAISTTAVGYGWGGNFFNALGNGTGEDATTPVAIPDAPPLAAIARGQYAACAISTAGTASCWGHRGLGEAGDGVAGIHRSPTPILGNGLDFTAISLSSIRGAGRTGSGYACALARDGVIYCWGSGPQGQLGIGAPGNRSVPTAIAGPQAGPFVDVAANFDHACGVTSAGEAYCWGDNAEGKLGDDTNTDRPHPTRVAGAVAFRRIAAGARHTCAISTQATLFCWGSNGFGRLGSGAAFDSRTPVAVAGVAGLAFTDLSAGSDHTCAVAAGALYCWGANAEGELGDGTTETRLTPVPIALPEPASTVTSGLTHTCVLTVTGAAYCWGLAGVGELGVADRNNTTRPQPVQGGHRFVSIRAGRQLTCGVEASGAGYCWGWGPTGQIGDGGMTSRSEPTRVPGEFRQIVPGYYHTCGLGQGSETFCWGLDFQGELGVDIAGAIGVQPVRGGITFRLPPPFTP